MSGHAPPNVGSQRLLQTAAQGYRLDKRLWTGLAAVGGARMKLRWTGGHARQVADALSGLPTSSASTISSFAASSRSRTRWPMARPDPLIHAEAEPSGEIRPAVGRGRLRDHSMSRTGEIAEPFWAALARRKTAGDTRTCPATRASTSTYRANALKAERAKFDFVFIVDSPYITPTRRLAPRPRAAHLAVGAGSFDFPHRSRRDIDDLDLASPSTSRGNSHRSISSAAGGQAWNAVVSLGWRARLLATGAKALRAACVTGVRRSTWTWFGGYMGLVRG